MAASPKPGGVRGPVDVMVRRRLIGLLRSSLNWKRGEKLVYFVSALLSIAAYVDGLGTSFVAGALVALVLALVMAGLGWVRWSRSAPRTVRVDGGSPDMPRRFGKRARGAALAGLVLLPSGALGLYVESEVLDRQGTRVGSSVETGAGTDSAFRVLVAGFDGPDDTYGLTSELAQRVHGLAADVDGLPGERRVHLEVLPERISAQDGPERALALADSLGGDIVLWGWYRVVADTARVRLNVASTPRAEVKLSPPGREASLEALQDPGIKALRADVPISGPGGHFQDRLAASLDVLVGMLRMLFLIAAGGEDLERRAQPFSTWNDDLRPYEPGYYFDRALVELSKLQQASSQSRALFFADGVEPCMESMLRLMQITYLADQTTWGDPAAPVAPPPRWVADSVAAHVQAIAGDQSCRSADPGTHHRLAAWAHERHYATAEWAADGLSPAGRSILQRAALESQRMGGRHVREAVRTDSALLEEAAGLHVALSGNLVAAYDALMAASRAASGREDRARLLSRAGQMSAVAGAYAAAEGGGLVTSQGPRTLSDVYNSDLYNEAAGYVRGRPTPWLDSLRARTLAATCPERDPARRMDRACGDRRPASHVDTLLAGRLLRRGERLARRAAPSWPGAYGTLSDISAFGGDWACAAVWLDSLAVTAPSGFQAAIALSQKASMERDVGRHSACVESLTRALEVDPAGGHYYFARAECRRLAGQPLRAFVDRWRWKRWEPDI